MRYASLYSIGISSVLLIVIKQCTAGFPNTDMRLLPMLVMHAARTLEYGTDSNSASILRHGLELVAVQVIAMSSSCVGLYSLKGSRRRLELVAVQVIAMSSSCVGLYSLKGSRRTCVTYSRRNSRCFYSIYFQTLPLPSLNFWTSVNILSFNPQTAYYQSQRGDEGLNEPKSHRHQFYGWAPC